MDKFKLVRHLNKGVTFSGVDMGGQGKILAENEACIVIKFPPGSCWAGRGCPRAYIPPRTIVLTKNKDGWAYKLIEFENLRKPNTK